MNLYSYFLTQTGSRIIKSAHYFPAYERHLSRWINKPLLMFEIGTGDGGSSQMWKQYFGPLARIVTVDIREICKNYEQSQIFVRIGDQANTDFLDSLIAEFGQPDIILDDGSHHMTDINKTFSHLYSQMTRDGVYIVEDLSTAYWEEYGGGLGVKGSFIERAKGLIDELHAIDSRGQVEQTNFSRQTGSIHFYTALIAFERAPYQNTELLQLPENPVMHSMQKKALPPLIASSISELCSYNDKQFIHCAYWTLLGREADSAGMDYFYEQLTKGASKTQIIADIKASPESKVMKRLAELELTELTT